MNFEYRAVLRKDGKYLSSLDPVAFKANGVTGAIYRYSCELIAQDVAEKLGAEVVTICRAHGYDWAIAQSAIKAGDIVRDIENPKIIGTVKSMFLRGNTIVDFGSSFKNLHCSTLQVRRGAFWVGDKTP